ncbi:MAG: hypothetical protein ACT4PS_12660 [Betaproteobacteria bacterium]
MDGLTLAHIAGLGSMAGVVCIGIAALLRRRADRNEQVVQAPMKRTRLIKTFMAHSGRAQSVILYLYQQYLDAGTWNNPAAERPGPMHILTEDGRRVDKIGTRKYRILGSKDVLVSDDMNAP